MSALKRLAVLTLVVAAAARLLAAPVTIKLATQAPANSTWHKALLDMGAAWNKNTAGRVKLQVYAGGTQGDEPTTIRMMRPAIGTLQAALLTAGGLAQIDDAFNVFAMPFFFENDDEELAVQQKLTPMLEQKLEAKGFHLLCWGTGGWVQLFSKKPLKTLDDVKGAKLYTSKGDDKMVQWYKTNGFHPVALLPADIPAQLKLGTGMIDTAPSTPYLALMLADLPRREVHARRARGAARRRADHHERRVEQDLRRGSAKVTEAAARDGNAHPRGRAQAGRRLDRHDDGARPRGDQARREGGRGVPRRGRRTGHDDARQHGAGRHLRHGRQERDAFRKSKGS